MHILVDILKIKYLRITQSKGLYILKHAKNKHKFSVKTRKIKYLGNKQNYRSTFKSECYDK